MTPKKPSISHAIKALSGLSLALAFAGCAAPLRFTRAIDPLSVMSADADLYLRLSGRAARDLAPVLLKPAQARSLSVILDRTDTIALAFFGSRPGRAAMTDSGLQAFAKTPIPNNSSSLAGLSFEAVLMGEFPAGQISFGLSTSRGWKRASSGFVNEGDGLGVSIPGRDVVLTASDSAGAGPEAALSRLTANLEEAILATRPSPLPARLEPFAAAEGGRELVLWAPDPFARLLPDFLGGDSILPLKGVLLTASRAGTTGRDGAATPTDNKAALGEEELFEATLVFLMDGERSARIFKPAAGLAWYAIAKTLFPELPALSRGVSFSTDGDALVTGGIRIPLSGLVAVAAKYARSD